MNHFEENFFENQFKDILKLDSHVWNMSNEFRRVMVKFWTLWQQKNILVNLVKRDEKRCFEMMHKILESQELEKP